MVVSLALQVFVLLMLLVDVVVGDVGVDNVSIDDEVGISLVSVVDVDVFVVIPW
jgi:hypothetical protein